MRSATSCLTRTGALSISRRRQDELGIPSWPVQQLCQLPNRMRGSDYAGFRIGPSNKAASRQELEGLQVSLPEQD